ncbi:MAG: hypothetical protein OJF58_003010 [Enhydrobacter sp.]|jgi:hypothetical protein|nr:MAG: hypothetical protein OJF58_003010 [Enhydrobacter sp.]
MAPAGHSPGHTHAKSAFIYATVLEEAIRRQVNDGSVTINKAGQNFSEMPATVALSAPMPARQNPPGHQRCSSWMRDGADDLLLGGSGRRPSTEQNQAIGFLG